MKALGNFNGVVPYVALEDGKLIQGTIQDCTAIAEDAKERHLAGHHGTSELKLAASLPQAIVETYMNVNGIDLAEFLSNPVHARRMCNDPALKDFRIWPGVV